MARGKQALANAAAALGIPAGPVGHPWYVQLSGDPSTEATVQCFTDDGTGSLANGSPRVLTALMIATTRSINVGQFLQILDDCVNRNQCDGSGESGPLAGTWYNNNLFDELTLTGGPDVYQGTYPLVCPGGTQPGRIIDLKRRSPNENVFDGRWDDGVCGGTITGLVLTVDGTQLQFGIAVEKGLGAGQSTVGIVWRDSNY